MPSLKATTLALLAATASALPATQRLDSRSILEEFKRQAPNGTAPAPAAPAAPLSDPDILQL